MENDLVKDLKETLEAYAQRIEKALAKIEASAKQKASRVAAKYEHRNGNAQSES